MASSSDSLVFQGAAVYQFSLVQTVDGFSQSVVVAGTPAAYRWFNARFGQTFAVPDRHVLRTPVAVVNQGIGALGLPVIQGVLQCIEHKVCSHGAALAPAHNSASVDVNHKDHTKATYCQPCHVDTYVKSDTQS